MEINTTHLQPVVDPRATSYVNKVPGNAPKASGGLGGILTRLFTIIVYDVTGGNGISPIRWNKLMNDYIRVASENNTSLDRTSIRGNSNKQLHKPSMTWNVLFKGLQFLKFEAFTIGLCGDLENGKKFNAYSSVSFVKNTKFEHLFPKELPGGHAVIRKNMLNGRVPKRSYSHEPGGVLARLFDLICLDLTDQKGFTLEQWGSLIDQWAEQQLQIRPKSKKVHDKSNTNKEFQYPKMTWKVFCKGLRFLKVSNFTLYVTAYRTDGLVSNCETSVNLVPVNNKG